MNDYNIYPTLLDSYLYMRDIEDEDERRAKETELIARINRIAGVTSPAMERGTMLNALVDSILSGEQMPDRYECEVVYPDGKMHYMVTDRELSYEYCFDGDMVSKIAGDLRWYMQQTFLSCVLDLCTDTRVRLYGFADYIGGSEVVDLKTTSRYTPYKYRNGAQGFVYPLCLWANGYDKKSVIYMTFKAVEVCDYDGKVSGDIYDERHIRSYDECLRWVNQVLRFDFLPWLEGKRELITDTKIFTIQ